MRFTAALGCIFIFITTGLAQWHQFNPDQADPLQPVFQDSLHHKLNFYDFSGNIAGLLADEEAFSLWAGSGLNYRSGDYRLAYQPAIKNDQKYSVRLAKPLTENDMFKGYFGYRRAVEQSVLWFSQNRMLETNPFVLADSSRGTWELNGLFWGGEWAHRFSRKWIAGAGIYYYVDQRLKQVFPKPENRHRDIHFRFGLQRNWQTWKTGIALHYFDEQEKVVITKYNLDQNLTPVMYKFRFSDLPLILLGKTSEERKIDYSGLSTNLHFSHRWKAGAVVMAAAGYSRSNGDVSDGGSRPQPQGSFTRQDFNGKITFQNNISARTDWRLTYEFLYRKFSADHPDFDLTISNHPASGHTVCLSARKNSGKNTRLFGDAGYAYYWNQMKDAVTENYYEYAYHSIFIRLGGRYIFSDRWEGSVWSAFNRYFTRDVNYTDNRYSDFFNILFLDRINYFRGQAADMGGGLQATYHYGPVFDVEFRSEYQGQIAGPAFTTAYEKNRLRHNWYLLIRFKFYII